MLHKEGERDVHAGPQRHRHRDEDRVHVRHVGRHRVKADAEQQAEQQHCESRQQKQLGLLALLLRRTGAHDDVRHHIAEHQHRRQGKQHERDVGVRRRQVDGEQVHDGAERRPCRQEHAHVLAPSNHEHLGPLQKDEGKPAARKRPRYGPHDERHPHARLRNEVRRTHEQALHHSERGNGVGALGRYEVALGICHQHHGERADNEPQPQKRRLAAVRSRRGSQQHHEQHAPKTRKASGSHWQHRSDTGLLQIQINFEHGTLSPRDRHTAIGHSWVHGAANHPAAPRLRLPPGMRSASCSSAN